MSSFDIEHKLRIFISSKCGGKYTIARKALKKLLLSTGLVEVYAYEEEPASSEDNRSAYLEYVDGSNLCIFLIDNEDGATPPVLNEEKRAKDKQLRLLYIFCDENKKEATPMQEEIRASLSQKYKVVHEFSDIVPAAYDSVMQDIIAVYKRKEIPFSDNNDTASDTPDNKLPNTEAYAFPFEKSGNHALLYRVLTERTLPVFSKARESEGSILEKQLSEQLKVVLSLREPDNGIIDSICSEALKSYKEEIHDLVKARFDAQKNYFDSNYDECLALLQNALKMSIEKQGVPAWLANDIAVDIRHVQSMIDEKNSQITLENPGQVFIENNPEPLYYPYLDRHIVTMLDGVAKKYYSQLNVSPNSINVGGLEEIFKSLVNAFYIAEMHGSIVQTIITSNRLITIYSMLCNVYEDHDFAVEYVRLLMINRDSKAMDSFIRTHSRSINSLNGTDINSILDSINCIFDPLHKMMSKYLLVSRLGYYLDEETFESLYNELVEYSKEWVGDEKRIHNMHKYINEFYCHSIHRVKPHDVINYLCSMFDNKLRRFFMDLF